MHIHETKFGIEQTVFLKTDLEQSARMVIAITIRPGGVAYYELGLGADSSFHFDVEMSSEQNEVTRLGLKIEQK